LPRAHSLLKIILYTKQQKTSTKYLGWNLFDPNINGKTSFTSPSFHL
jgi:hypothetical protein